MGQYDLFRKIAQSSLNEKQRSVNSIQNDIINDFKSSPSYVQGYINNETTLKDFHIVTKSLKDEKKLLSFPNETFSVGDVINISVWNMKFLVIDIDEDQQIQTKGTIKLINNTLKFYPSTSNQLVQIPCIVGKGKLSLDENKFLSIPADENIVLCPNTVDSLKINTEIRFILSGDPYSVIGIDKLENVGLLTIRIKEDQINSADDNLELGIANYYSHQSIKEIYILNGDSANLLYTNATLQLDILAKENGIIIENPTVTYSSDNTYVCTVDVNGLITAQGTGDAIVTVAYGNVSASINIHSEMVVEDNYNIVITPTDTTLKLSRSIAFTAHAMNNGVEDLTRQFIWSLSNLDGSSNVYTTIDVDDLDDSICTITASSLSSVANKYVVLRCSLTSDNTIFTERQIKLINLF